jgi:RNA polymerase sigma-70 factor (ECF subfamily)
MPMTDGVDNELVKQVQKGDKEAFNLLVQKYQFRIIKLVTRYVQDPSEAMDVAQEAFIKAYRSLANFRGDSAFYTWLYRIAINTAKNYVILYNKRRQAIEVDVIDLEQSLNRASMSECGTPEGLLIKDEIEDAVYQVIDHLPIELRIAILLREMEGLSYEEISGVMNCPIGTVRSRIYRAREAIELKIKPMLHL